MTQVCSNRTPLPSLVLRAGSIVALVIMLPSSALASESIDFETQIRPLLISHCSTCHGLTAQKAGLRLDVKSAAIRGGDSGAVIVPGDPDHSEMFRRITSDDPEQRMPPEGERLNASRIDLIRRWIAEGANWPETDYDRAALRDSRRDHWAWQPIRQIQPPEIVRPEQSVTESTRTDVSLAETSTSPLRNEIDRFIAVKLAEHRLQMSPEADRRTLIRRLSFDLLGLPPTPEEVQAFVNDTDPDAWEKCVDRFLASPHYGERQTQHWLDIAHYADTHGFERDQRRDNAWRYRDWVIRAMNSDLPYDQFLRDQIAGDAFRPGDPQAVEATGFLAAGPWDFVGQQETPSPVLKRLARADDLDDMVTQVMTAACGVTVNCARCHDHKLDPISQQEYYSLTAVFAGVKRGERIVSPAEEQQLRDRKTALESRLKEVRGALAELRGDGWSLADIVGGGDGRGSGTRNSGIDPITGKVQLAKRGFLDDVILNRFVPSPVRFVDGVVIPSGRGGEGIPVTSTGILVRDLPETSGKAWDAIRNGPVNSPFSTVLGDVDFAVEPHSLLSIHANAAVTFDLQEIRENAASLSGALQFRSSAGYFGQTARRGASLHVLLDGKAVFERSNIGRDDGLLEILVLIPETARFLTLMATDAGNGIGHDQIGFGDATLEFVSAKSPDDSAQAAATEETQRLGEQLTALQKELAALPEPAKIYSVVSESPPEVRILHRGSPEDPGDAVAPAALSCVTGLNPDFGSAELTDHQRRIALASWITDPRNPLTRRVIVNRLWQHHFGNGIVDTPSDLGLGGGRPSHPELLDWLAEELLRRQWSLKSIQRLICTSAVYRQSSLAGPLQSPAAGMDSGNRLLWRQNPRRVDAESFRDSVLAVSGKLNRTMFGPGYRDFEYKEEYAPVYTYITADAPELWRRSIYRFVVRTTPDQFLTTLDCPSAANLTPSRNVTTTALQSLALLNHDFMLRQADYFSDRLQSEFPEDAGRQAERAFELAFGRPVSASERAAAVQFLRDYGGAEFCRMLFNANEFSYVD